MKSTFPDSEQESLPPPAFTNPNAPTREEVESEVRKILASFPYFVEHYCFIQDKDSERWIPFELWEQQKGLAQSIQSNPRLAILKSRQLGITWLSLCYIIWIMLTRRGQMVLLLSIGLRESKDAMIRLKGIYRHLPTWMKGEPRVTTNNSQEFGLSNESRCKSLPSNAGDSYSCALVICDEFDLVEDQEATLRAVQPTIEDGNSQLILLSRVNKSKPNTPFKKIYRAARAGENSYTPVFLPWSARPDRSQAWYESVRRNAIANEGHLDTVFEQYPETEDEALAPNSQDKRIPIQWLNGCMQQISPVDLLDRSKYNDAGRLPTPTCPEGLDVPLVAGLKVWELPIHKSRGSDAEVYTIAGDPAEGNPNSDDSAASVMNSRGEQVACFAGKIEPGTFGEYLCKLSDFYNNAKILVERNNHGHAVILKIRELGYGSRLIAGKDGKAGWMSSKVGKTAIYDNAAELLRDGEVSIRDHETFQQLASLETDMHAPEGEHDDRSDAFALNAMAYVRVGIMRNSPMERIGGDGPGTTDVRVQNLFGLGQSDEDRIRSIREVDPEFCVGKPKRAGIFG